MAIPGSLTQDTQAGGRQAKFPFGLVLGGLSLIQGITASNSANDRAKESLSLEERKLKLEEESAKRLRDYYEHVYGKVHDAEARGDFDPDTYQRQFDQDFEKNNRYMLPNLATAQTVAGYRPGDSESVRRENLLKKGLSESYRSGRLNARKQALSELLAAYQSTNPELIAQSGGMAGRAYGDAANAYSRDSQRLQGQVPDIASLYQLYNMTQTKTRPSVNSNTYSGNWNYDNLYA